jgi:adhesin/invasin
MNARTSVSIARLPIVALVMSLVFATSCGDDAATGPSSQIVSTTTSVVSASHDTLASGSEAELHLESRDGSGRRLNQGGLAVEFSVAGGSSQGVIGETVDHGDGSYTAAFTGTIAGSPVTIDATIDGRPVTSEPRGQIRVVAGPPSPLTSQLELSTRWIDIGSESHLRLVTRDLIGNEIAEGGHAVEFSTSGGTSTGTLGATTDEGDGTYTAVFTATGVGTATTVVGKIDGNAIAMTDSITVKAGRISPAHSIVTVSADTVTEAVGVLLTLEARDSAGNRLSTGGRTVAFSASQGAGVSEGVIDSDSVDLEDGTYVATFTATAAGSPTIIAATIDGDSVTTPLPTITVIQLASSPQNTKVIVDDAMMDAGELTTLRLHVFDTNGDSVTSGGLDVIFTASEGSTTGGGAIGEAVDHDNGTYSASFLATRAGDATTIGAMIDSTRVEMLDSLGNSMLPTITVSPGAESTDSSLVTVSDALISLGDTSMLTLQARDAFGNDLTVGGLTVAFTATTDAGQPAGRVSATADGGDGSYTATYVATAEITANIGATINGVAVTSERPTISALCGIGTVSVDSSIVTVNDGVVASGVATSITLRARDAEGNCLRNSGLTVVFTASGGTSTGDINPGIAIDNNNGAYTATFTGVVAGTPTSIGATIDGATVTSASPTIQVVPGDVSAATSGVVVEKAEIDSGTVDIITLVTRDAVGNARDEGGHDVVFTISGGTSTGALSGTTDRGDGTYTAGFTGRTVGTPVSIGAIIDGNTVTTASPTIEVVAGTISSEKSIVSASANTVTAGDTLTLTLKGIDDFDRELVGGGRNVAFSHSGGTSTGAVIPPSAIDNDDGTYTAYFVGQTAGLATTIEATIDGASVTSTLPTVTVVPGAASTSESAVTVADDTLAVGAVTIITLQARDAFGNDLTVGGLDVEFALQTEEGASEGTIGSTTDNGDGTYTATFTAVTAGSPVAILATIDGQAVTSAPPTITVQ